MWDQNFVRQTESTLFVSHSYTNTHTLTNTVIQNFQHLISKKYVIIPSPYESEIILELKQSDFVYSKFFLLTVCVAPIFLFNICISRFNTFSKSTGKAAKGLRKAMLYISSTKNSEIMLWHSHLDVYASTSCSLHCQMAHCC